MKDFLFKMPTKIVFGVNKALKIGDIIKDLGMKKVFIVTDKFLKSTECVQNLVNSLISQGFEVTVFTDIVPEPPIEVVNKAADILKESDSDVVIAVGGGSTIDICKAMCMLKNNEGSIKEYLFGGTREVEKESLPLIAVPTTAGSGSEVTAASVISDKENNIKLSVTDEKIIPKMAIVDPIMHMGMPPLITASTGMDALTHAIECYVSKNASIISDTYAEAAIKLIGANIYKATFNPNDIEGRSNMALASILAAVAFSNGGLGAVHGISQALGGVANIPHGIANSMLLPKVMEKNMVGNLEKFKNIAEFLGENVEGLSLRDAAQKSVERVRVMAADLKIPAKLSEMNVTRDMFREVVTGTMDYRMLSLNPVKFTEEDVYEILEKAM